MLNALPVDHVEAIRTHSQSLPPSTQGLSTSGPSAGAPWPSPAARRSASLSALPTRSLSPLGALRNGFAAHRFVVDNILRRVTNTQAAALRRRAARQLSSGQSAPFLALLGVSLASGTGMVTKEDEVECVCGEIRQAAAKVRLSGGAEEEDQKIVDPSNAAAVDLRSLDIGSIIAKVRVADLDPGEALHFTTCRRNAFFSGLQRRCFRGQLDQSKDQREALQ